MVVVEASGHALVASNVDLRPSRVGGLDTDLAARFLDRLAAAAGLTIHVRLIEGEDTDHVLEAMFKALGVALAQATGATRREE
jgi:imidazoleglycerol-phosphate dehydratase